MDKKMSWMGVSGKIAISLIISLAVTLKNQPVIYRTIEDRIPG